MSTVPIAELRAKFSAYLERVRSGEEVVVTDRGRPVARLIPVAESDGSVKALTASGLARAPLGELPPAFWEMRRPDDPKGVAMCALLDERAEGR